MNKALETPVYGLEFRGLERNMENQYYMNHDLNSFRGY